MELNEKLHLKFTYCLDIVFKENLIVCEVVLLRINKLILLQSMRCLDNFESFTF